ncbi:hypothetical protein LWP59_02615 [Amycolatopsis acidiphila]|uniref:Uncharacterized protein n=1 Tax=Amycolatopsis acidiphila TaxID=715473 RepID=A0A558A3S2_9PSEU|nr:hypothetical protein [Amycolatopsis acidiphila]TVT18900.1 hypothetical protein FNH06_26055 [Amycolatopsis acidiphila]UIJ60596.1 hypothetical protein LWP59_02615 [Amycolatopsis acidiphila]GHG81882.1 hypothetical protein GCM10017788_52010 [Amycolatopsis acidiphila]
MATAADALIDPERAFLGCLLHLPATLARRVLAGMRADDLAGALAAPALQLVIELVAAGTAPAPVAVYAHAVATGRAAGEKRREWLSGWLIDTYRDAPPPALADHLKTVVLEAAWRRALLVHAHRIEQAIDTTDTAALRELADDGHAGAAELWSRYQAALGDSQSDISSALEVAA